MRQIPGKRGVRHRVGGTPYVDQAAKGGFRAFFPSSFHSSQFLHRKTVCEFNHSLLRTRTC
jgi:hypothetical protein